MYGWLKLVHVLAAIAAVGTNVTYFWWLRVARHGGREATTALEGITALDRRVANPGYIVLPITGVAMVLVGDVGFSTLWVASAIGLYVALGAFAGIFFAPSLRRQVELARDGHGGDEYAAAARRTLTTGMLTMLIIAVILYLMVLKPT